MMQCPSCGTKMSGEGHIVEATGMASARSMADDDVTVCVICCAALQMRSGALVEMTAREFRELPASVRALLERLHITIHECYGSPKQVH